MTNPTIVSRDFSSFSASARFLLLAKGYTNIPFARRVAELLEYPKPYVPDFQKKNMTLAAAAFHFESRYLSVDQLLKDLPVKNILELSSGYSFRSLDFARREGVHYIDTDLPEIISTKRKFAATLEEEGAGVKGTLELLPLNVLDEESFREIAGHFPQGELAVVNEGLLTYLHKEEQEKVCSTIHGVLRERGGWWITGDIYLRNKQPKLQFQYPDEMKKFYERHDTESNSFVSFEEAARFFRGMGFVLDREASVKRSEVSALKYFMRSVTLWQLLRFMRVGTLQATWRLKAV
jgi:hypothetical protein